MQKYVWAAAIVIALGLTIWLLRVMPNQAWAQWNGDAWVIAGEGWAVLWYAWPTTLLGGLIGVFAVGGVLAWSLKLAKEADHQEQIKQLMFERDKALANAENRVKQREAEAIEQERQAFLAEQRAAQEIAKAKAAQEQAATNTTYANQEIERAKYRTKNAVAAANRIKQKLNE